MGSCHTIFCMDLLYGWPGFDFAGISDVLVIKMLFQLMVTNRATVVLFSACAPDIYLSG